jgi:hypothetical protein
MRALVSAIFLASLLSAAPARAQDPAGDAARAHFDRGAGLAAERRYAEAALAFKAAFEADPRKETLFAWAQVERLAGNCTAANDLYGRFLAQPGLTAAQREAAELNLRRCEPRPAEAIAADPATAKATPSPVLVPRARAPEQVVAAPAPSRAGGLLRVALLAGSATALVGAATFFQLSRDDARDAASAPIWDDYFRALEQARTRQRLAVGLLAGGAALGAAALVHWLLTAQQAPLAAWLAPTSAGLRGRF